MFTLRVRNLRALGDVAFTPRSTCALIGPNGSGKTTVLLTLKLLRAAYERGVMEAVTTELGGSYELKSWDAGEQEPIEVGVDLGDLSWRLRLIPSGASVNPCAPEQLAEGGEVVFSRSASGELRFGGRTIGWNVREQRTGLRVLVDRQEDFVEVDRMASFLKGIHTYCEPDLRSLRLYGSRSTENRRLSAHGTNAFTLLRQWSNRREHRHRYQFVVAGLQSAFPRLCADLDFEEAGNTIAVRVWPPESDQPSLIGNEANGLLAMLVLLCNVAGGEEGGVVAIDEPENGLHPGAIREFLQRSSQWADQHSLTLILMTHSPVILDHLPTSQVLVIPSAAAGRVVPLSELSEPDWLVRFKAGELPAGGEPGPDEGRHRGSA